MTRPITCSNGHQIGVFAKDTGVIVEPSPPSGLRVFGAYLNCPQCGRNFKFDGLRAAKKLRQQQSPLLATK